MQAPPTSFPEDVTAAEKRAEEQLAKEKEGMIGVKKKGMYGTILTSGKGVEEEAATSKTMLGGSKPIY